MPSQRPKRVNGYSVTRAAAGYSNVTGLVSGFAFTAVVLSITVAGSKDLTAHERLDVGFATAMFVVGFLGCLLCSYSMASLSGEEDSPATFTCAVLNGSGTAVGLIAVLAGFASLSSAFLDEASAMFLAICLVAIFVAPPFIFSPQWDIVLIFGKPPTDGPPRNKKAAKQVVFGPTALGLTTAVLALIARVLGSFEVVRRWTYLVLAVVALLYVVAMVLACIAIASGSEKRRLSVRATWMIGTAQCALMLVIVALVPT